MAISESILPGVGRRYELDVRDRDRVVAVVHNSGMGELFIFRPGADEPRGSARLDVQSTRDLGSILAGAWFQPADVDPAAAVMQRFVFDVVHLPDTSAIVGRSLEELELRRRTGVTCIAILSGETTTLDPAPGSIFAAGDDVVVVGMPGDIERFRELVDGRSTT